MRYLLIFSVGVLTACVLALPTTPATESHVKPKGRPLPAISEPVKRTEKEKPVEQEKSTESGKPKGRPLPSLPDSVPPYQNPSKVEVHTPAKEEEEQQRQKRPLPAIPVPHLKEAPKGDEPPFHASSNIDDHPKHADPDKPLTDQETSLGRTDHVQKGQNWKGKKKSKFTNGNGGSAA